MKFLLSTFLSLFCTLGVIAQYSVCTNASIEDSHLAVSINTSTANADISVMIGENFNTRDLSIGFTETRSEADVIVSDNKTESDLIIVKARLSDANLSVSYGEKLINPSVRIEVMESGTVDFLVYNESQSFDIESLILSLLPIINAHLGYQFEAIPYWGSEEMPEVENEQAEQIIEPTEYAGINLAQWITNIEDGIIQLGDNSLFVVYNDDRYISKLWQKKNDVVVTPTEVMGHYYITKDGGIYKDAETLRAICIKGN